MQALKTFGSDVAIAFSGAEDVALVEFAHLTGRPYRVFRYAAQWSSTLLPPVPAELLHVVLRSAPDARWPQLSRQRLEQS